MMVRMFLLVWGCLCWGICLAAFSRLDAEDFVRRALSAKNIREGCDSETGMYTVIASAEKKGMNPDSPMSCALQSSCFRLAELRALHQILNMRSQSMAGRTSVQHDATNKLVRTFVETMSHADLDGCLVTDFYGRQEGDRCVVTVAMSWSDELERRAHASAAGSLRPADSWIDELKSRLGKLGDSLLPPTMSFVDSAGFFHRVGVGTASFDGDSDLRRSIAVSMADRWARKNLQLALFGRAEMRKKAELMMSQDRKEGEQSLASVYEALSEVAADTPLPVGNAPLLYKLVEGCGSKRSMFIVCYGVDQPMSTCVEEKDLGSQTIGKPPEGVLIWNPNTGNYEKKE